MACCSERRARVRVHPRPERIGIEGGDDRLHHRIAVGLGRDCRHAGDLLPDGFAIRAAAVGGWDNPSDMRCPSCGNENREGARFCDSCGAELTAQPVAAEPRAEPPSCRRSGRDRRPLPGAALPRPGRPQARLPLRRHRHRHRGRGRALRHRGRRRVDPGQGAARGRGDAQARRPPARRHRPRHRGGGRQPVHRQPLHAGRRRRGAARRRRWSSRGGAGGRDRRGRHPRARARARARHRPPRPEARRTSGSTTTVSRRLGDFGLATTEARARVSGGTLVGTVAYLPPEQALGDAAGPRSDLYSLGAMLYEMVTGQPPFPGDDAVSIISQHLHADPVPPSRHNRRRARGARSSSSCDCSRSGPRTGPPTPSRRASGMLAALDEQPAEAAEERPANPLESLAGGVFVGRERELEQLREAVDSALAGRGSLQLLVGEPGIGKTRTSEELATYARVSGARVYWGRCREDEGAPAYWPWVQAIRAYARDADPVALAWQLGAGAPEVAQLVPEIAEKLDVEPGARPRQRGGALPALRLGHEPAAGGRARPADRDRPRRPALGRRALAAPAPLRRPRAGLERPPGPRHLPRRRARPPPPAGPRARRDVGDRGQRADPAARPLRRRGRALHRDDRRHPGAARPGRRGPGADRRQPVLRRRGRPPARQRGQARARAAAPPSSRSPRGCARSSGAASTGSARRRTRPSGSRP